MNLEQFASTYDVTINIHSSGTYYLLLSPKELNSDLSWDLFHLSDYAISTVSGPTYWLRARSKD